MPLPLRVCLAVLILSCASAAQAQGVKQGKLIFTEKAEPPCAVCHTLKNAEAEGEVGPNLDELKPDQEKVRNAVKNGVGNMPPYDDSLSDAEIAAVARYVAEATKTGK